MIDNTQPKEIITQANISNTLVSSSKPPTKASLPKDLNKPQKKSNITSKKLSIRQLKFLKEIPRSRTLKEAGEKAGYKLDKGNRCIYRPSTQRHIRETYSPEVIIKKFEELHGIALKRNDLSNANRSLEDLARINAMFTDKQEITGEMSNTQAVIHKHLTLTKNSRNISTVVENKVL